MRDYFQGGKLKHWSEDPYQCAAFSYSSSSLEFQLSEFQSLISNIHFIGEHTSRNRGWVEGAISSAIQAALSITDIYCLLILI
jgi:monoamine oxidase